MKKISLELGGKSPNIVFADADLEKFAAAAPMSVFDNAGQNCTARSRILVERSVHERVVELFAAQRAKLVVGDPAIDKTQVGSLVHQQASASGSWSSSIGARTRAPSWSTAVATRRTDAALAARRVPDADDLRRARTRTCASSARRSSDRSSAIIPFDDEEEAVRKANDTPYGLAGSVWTRDIGRAHPRRQARSSGTISINSNETIHTEAPFGGYKMSGLGRELGMHALDEYTEIKNVFVDLS